MSQVVPCPVDKIILRASKLYARGMDWHGIGQKLGLNETFLEEYCEENARAWHKELNRARREILAESVNTVVLRMMALLENSDEEKHFKAADRVIKIFVGQTKKKTRPSDSPKPIKAKVIPTSAPTVQQAQAEQLSPEMLDEARAFQKLTDEEKQRFDDIQFDLEFRRRRDSIEDPVDRAAMEAFTNELREAWYAGTLFPCLQPHELSSMNHLIETALDTSDKYAHVKKTDVGQPKSIPVGQPVATPTANTPTRTLQEEKDYFFGINELPDDEPGPSNPTNRSSNFSNRPCEYLIEFLRPPD